MYKALILEDEEPAMWVLLHALKAHPELDIVATCNVYQFAEGKLLKRIWAGSLTQLLKNELSTPQFVRISSKHAINHYFLKGSADRRALCVLNRADLPEVVKLRVPENRRKQVWGELLG